MDLDSSKWLSFSEIPSSLLCPVLLVRFVPRKVNRICRRDSSNCLTNSTIPSPLMLSCSYSLGLFPSRQARQFCVSKSIAFEVTETKTIPGLLLCQTKEEMPLTRSDG